MNDSQADLRHRIAGAIASRYCTLDKSTPCVPCMVTSLDLADAVIAELGLRTQGLRNGFFLVPDPPWDQHRYVTDWQADDE